MGLSVALIDKSEVIKKMISHCLHYYAAEIHRFDSLDDLKSQINHLNPDLIFVDWDLKQGTEPTSLIAQKEIQDTPIITIYRTGEDQKIKDIPHRIKKPLDANLLRKMVTDLIPKLNKSKIHQFLKYPENQSSQEKKAPASNKEETKTPVLNFSPNEERPTPKTKESTSFDLPTIDDDKDLLVKGGEAMTSWKGSNKKDSSKTNTSITPTLNLNDNTKTNISAPKKTSSKTKSSIPPTLNLNDNTDSKVTPSKNIEENILKVLQEYKTTLEFENLIEKTLKNYAESISQKMLEKDSEKILKKSLEDFKQQDSFRNLILETLSNYIKEHSEFRTLFEKELQKFIKEDLINLSKKMVEQEIQKILEEEN